MDFEIIVSDESVEIISEGTLGPPGVSSFVEVGTVTTGPAGSEAVVTNSGTASEAVLNFVIPRGDVGDVTPEATQAKNDAEAAAAAALVSQTAASDSETAAAASQSSATDSAASASESAVTATIKAIEASASADDAAASQVSTTESATLATSKANEASLSAAAAALSSSEAAQSANAAADSADAASDSSAASSASATSSAGSASKAQEWATKTTSEVEAGQGFGAKKYAQDASTLANAAETAAAESLTHSQTAAEHASDASNSASDANASALSAATSSESAATYASTAEIQAAEATDQAATATTQAGNAAISAGTATTQADTATAQAEVATIQATTATTKASEASASASAASVSAAAALASQTASAGSAAAANTSAGAASGSAANALAIYGTAAAQQAALINAQAAASVAQGFAASAASVAQQDLSGVTSAALHRSPNAVTAMFLYDTSKDSDGGAWTEKCQHTSWYNEPLCGKWLGAQDSELNARYANPTSGPELISNGNFASDTSGWTTTNANVSVSGGVATITPLANLTRQGLSQGFTTVVGATYRLTYRVASGGGGNTHVYVGTSYASNANGSGSTAVGARTLIFTATATTTVLTVGVWGIGETLGIADVSIRLVTAINTSSNDYFQLTTDGKFYRLWKNIASHSNDLSNTYWAKEGSATVIGTNVINLPVAEGRVLRARPVSVGDTVTISALYSGSGTISIWNEMGSTASLRVTLTATPTRYSVTHTSTTTGLAYFQIARRSGAGDATSVTVSDVQIEYGSTATVYEAKGAEGSISEVFRGNKRKFPKLAGIVAEAANVTIYDLTEPGRPMWMRFLATGGGAQYMLYSGVSGLHVQNGYFGVAPSGGYGFFVVNFSKDTAHRHYTSSNFVFANGIASRNTNLTTNWQVTTAYTGFVRNNNVNAIAMTVLPDAPVDPVTGLKVPTIAVATADYVSLIQNNGVVLTITSGGGPSTTSIDITPDLLTCSSSNTAYWYYIANPGKLTANANFNSIAVNGVPYFNTSGGSNARRWKNAAAKFDASRVGLLRHNASTVGKGIGTVVANTFNTGHLVGDIRRAYLADVDVGSVSGPELVVNGTFDTDTTGWVAHFSSQLSSISGVLRVENTSSTTAGRAVQSITTVIGKSYKVTGDVTAASTTFASISVSNNADGSGAFSISPLGVGSKTLQFIATATTTRVVLGVGSSTLGATADFDNIFVKEVVADRSYKAQGASITGTLTKSQVASAAQLVAYSGFSASNYLREPYSADLDFGTGEWSAGAWVNVPTSNAAAGTGVSRAFSSGAYITIGIDATNKITATAFDGTTTRTATTTAAYNTATWLKAEAQYKTDGSLAIAVNGQEVAVTRGTPLLTLNNSNAVLTIGNSYALDAPFLGSIALLKASATVPTAEQSLWMYEQEKQMFRDGAQVTLPDAGSIVDLTYDDATDKWIAVSATNESEWSGLVRTSVTPSPAGSYTKVTATSGVQLQARRTTNPGVDITIPAYGLREELVKRSEAAARLNAQLAVFDFVGGFTANTTSGSTAITSVAGLTYPVSYIGARISGAGIPANTTIVGVSGTTLYLSAAATATASTVQISFFDFVLPVGHEAKVVSLAGVAQREGATQAWQRLFDGFKETVRFNTSPNNMALIQIQAARSAA